MLIIRVYPDDAEPYDLRVGSRVILEWEAQSPKNSAVRFDTNPKMDDAYSIAYIAARRAGKYEGSFDSWKKEVDIERLPDPPDPTQQEASIESIS